MTLRARLNPNEALGDRVLKVNHAGENGAVHIYSGQLMIARWTAQSLVAELADFRAHEIKHRATFQDELQRRGRPRCRNYHLCGLGGFVLGMVSALFGRRAIAATTVAVERVVLRHLEQQLAALDQHDLAAAAAIRTIVDEERHHHDRSAAHLGRSRFWSAVLAPLVALSTEAVIWVGMHA